MTNEIETLLGQGHTLASSGQFKSALDLLRDVHHCARQTTERLVCAYHLGSLNWEIIGNGLEARRLFQETVESAAELLSKAKPAPVRELEANACENLMLLSFSYDEYESWAERLRALQPSSDILRGHVPKIREIRKVGRPWSDVMLMVASSYYNRKNPALDAGRYGAAKSIYHLLLANRKALRVPRTDWKVAANEYAKLVMRITKDCWVTLQRQHGPNGCDTHEFTFVIEEAIPLVAEYVTEHPDDNEVREDLARLDMVLRHLKG